MIRDVKEELIARLAAISPHYQQLFKPPATEEALCKLEKTLEVVVPSDFRDFLRMHDGCRDNKLLICFTLFSVDDIALKTECVREDLKKSERVFRDGGWDGQKLMIGDSFVGWTLVIDCNSGTPFVYSKSSYALPLADSFLEYLVGVRDNLREGKYEVAGGNVCMDEWGERL